ncbi:hypothetical protein L0F63_006459, partial [Massospora cicadina]
KKIENCFGLEGDPFYSCYTNQKGELVVIDTPARLKDFFATEVSANVIEIFLKREADHDLSLRKKLNRSITIDIESRSNDIVNASGVYLSKSKSLNSNLIERPVRSGLAFSAPKPRHVEEKPRVTKNYSSDNWLDNTVVTPWDEAPGLKNPVLTKSFSLDLPEKSASSAGNTFKNTKRIQIKLSDIECHKYGDERPPSFKAASIEEELDKCFETLSFLQEGAKGNVCTEQAPAATNGGVERDKVVRDAMLPNAILQTTVPDEMTQTTYERSVTNVEKAPNLTTALKHNKNFTGDKDLPLEATPSELKPKLSLNPMDAAKLKKASDLKKLFQEYDFVFDASSSAEEIMFFLLDQILSDVNIDLEVVRRGLQRRAINSQPFDSSDVVSEPTKTKPSKVEIKQSAQQYLEVSDDESDSLDFSLLGTLSDSRWVKDPLSQSNKRVVNLKNLVEKPISNPGSVALRPAVNSINKSFTSKNAFPHFKLGFDAKAQVHQKFIKPQLNQGVRGRLIPKAYPPNQRFERAQIQLPKFRKVAAPEVSPIPDLGTFSEVEGLHLGKLSFETDEGLLQPL